MIHVIFILASIVLSAVGADAATRYISTGGTNSGGCTNSGAPCKTWAYALQQMVAGDTLVVKNGTYSSANGNGDFSVDCNAGYPQGSAGNYIKIIAENERQALLQGRGATHVMRFANCGYWWFEGLRQENIDATPTGATNTIYATNTHHFVMRRNLLRFTNRNGNIDSTVYIDESNNWLIEENEIYKFHRHGIFLRNAAGASGNHTVRRNYVNGESYPDTDTGTNAPGMGDTGYINYPSNTNLFENNIVENTGSGFDTLHSGPGDEPHNIRWYGNIARHTETAIGIAGYPGQATYAQDIEMRDMVVLDSTNSGWIGYGINLTCTNCSFLKSVHYGIGVGYSDMQATASDSVRCTNCLVTDTTGGVGVGVTPGTHFTNWLYEYINSYGNGTNYSPSVAAGGAHYSNATSIDPQMGTCLAWIPSGSPMRNTGKNVFPATAHKGAEVLWRYQNGTLTSEPLWNTTTGAFPCGAVISGVNSSGNVCSNVQNRLNINTNGCAFPSGYGTPIETGVVAYYHFNGTVVDQASPPAGGGHDGTLVGDASVASNALVLDGSGDYVSVSNTTGMHEAAFCLSAHLKPTSGAAVSVLNFGDGYGLSINGASALISGFIYNGSTYPTLSASAPSVMNGAWHAAVVNYSGSAMTVHYDGAQIGSQAMSGLSSVWPGGSQFRMGAGPAGESPFAGTIDEVRVLNRACTPQEIASWVVAGEITPPAPPTNLRVVGP